MKEHLKSYFPERFNDNGLSSFSNFFTRSFMELNDAKSKQSCEQLVSYVYDHSAELRLLSGAMRKYGCDFKLSRHVACEWCVNCKGGYDPDTNQIVICQDNFATRNNVMNTMMHEMVHMFDYCRAKMDFNNLEHVACSEIRAANLTFCSITDKLRFGGPLFSFKNMHQYCVKDVAFASVKAYSPETSDEELRNIVDKVFPTCYNDLEPFGRRPMNGTQNMRQSFRERYYYGYV